MANWPNHFISDKQFQKSPNGNPDTQTHTHIHTYTNKQTIEGINIEYGKIENCKIDTILASKMRWLVTSKKNDGNIKFNFENGNIDSKTGS
jgi:hypothetical protein